VQKPESFEEVKAGEEIPEKARFRHPVIGELFDVNVRELADRERHAARKKVFFHLFFKVTALVVYLCLDFLTNNFILTFVTCVLCLAFDFWVSTRDRNEEKRKMRLLISLRRLCRM
jgi:hypothetical protein